MSDSSSKRDAGVNESENVAKRLRTTSVCVKCSLDIGLMSKIACSKCSKYVHGKRSCSGLTVLEFNNQDKINMFVCENCNADSCDMQIDLSSVDEESTDLKTLKQILNKFNNQLSLCLNKIDKMTLQYQELKDENSEMKVVLNKLLNHATKDRRRTEPNRPLPHNEERGRSRSRRRQRSSSRTRSSSVKFRNPKQRNCNGRSTDDRIPTGQNSKKIPTGIGGRKENGRASRSHPILITRTVENYSSEEHRQQL